MTGGYNKTIFPITYKDGTFSAGATVTRATSSDALTFVTDANTSTEVDIQVESSTATCLNTTYFCNPSLSGDNANGALTFTLPFKVYKDSDNSVAVDCSGSNAKTVTVAADYTGWESNKVYTYVFSIGGVLPIYFDKVTIDDYDFGFGSTDEHKETINLEII